ncbi:Na/Pi cotransporter family protein [Bariatricus massiliensis]|uniref:Na/Pi cotransporter family protein n=1 Tax=Bariatricus massiliensis TaxID=1745713 RepID=A0ABS8DDJ2_9FIRM|nr:Na/Pi cotransporter family protein [Bariatricus massiliensis]MCB7302596.1 Na/Pi cotransporter family protein [Bariatricus massiliensis]MCB7373812.1 Na/Pi cotransporter family protein [Bariatricus massiliensis]MCB7386482.1 Na/Pi cotransporter family protein [Bariatricus massiliensis]MCB7410644.1 Na/Pi cotransporter family protein [Bariatricus massiliensis]MCQ5253518.1 Na/Pi cotransporter family protein [Bariatricus massiliensis]
MEYTSIIIPFVGGLGMFIYGMQIMAQGLENAAGNRMKSLLEVLTKNKFFGVLLGAFITAVIQSSSATTVMVVGFVNAGIMNLQQAMGVIMGANVGTTVTGWLVSSVEWAKFLSPSTLAPIAIMIGVIIMLTGKRRSAKDIASIVIGFGLLFVGISTMSSAVAPLKESEAFCNIFVRLGHNPFLGILAGAAVTAIIQSSSASVGILQSLAAAGLVPFSAAIYIIMGQNIGTCVTAILSSMGAKKNAKTAALMHLLFNIIGTVIFSVGAILFLKIANPVWGHGMISQTQISLAHTIFNIATTVLLFPASNLIIKLAKVIGRVEDTEVDDSKVHLDDRMLETPTIAIQSVISEIVRMGHIVADSLKVAKEVLFTQDQEQITFLKEEENKVDRLSAGITEYAIKLSGLQISEREHQAVSHMLQVVSDMERISDYCENISEFAETLVEKKVAFSDVGEGHLKEMMDVCTQSYLYSLEAFESNDKESALRTVEKETEADGLEISLRSKHIKRLTNNQCNTEAGIVFLDTLVCMERISDHARNIAEEVLED